MNSDEYTAFTDALFDPAACPPSGLKAWHKGAVTKRFSVYRNNVIFGLINALAERFPVCLRLVGADFFGAMAKSFVRSSPPKSPILVEYGEGFPGFIATFEWARELRYLADVARLEWAIGRAYHAADSTPLALESIRAVPADALGDAIFTLHPSVQIISSRFPILSIWSTNTFDTAVQEVSLDRGEDVLVLRPHLEVEARLLPPGGFSFVSALIKGETVSAASSADLLDLPACLRLLFLAEAITAISA
ncbi:DNA-binding domain-containing protein [Methylocystis echinoides]|uniref:HvfC/BufC N-terminal domain-containing protein n=1 Tax=Methylocystis echinoides TaxID=29468 RepID=UPI003436EA4E